MSRKKSLIIVLSVFAMGYLVSYFYTTIVIKTEYELGIHQDLFYLFYIPILYLMVQLLFGRPIFSKYIDAFAFFIIAIFRIYYDYITKEELILSNFYFAVFGLIALLILVKLFFKGRELENTMTNNDSNLVNQK
ncbi:hypothetical protein [Pleomorphovibrio marinus]|uniref:hypothetical protein n=1 Tax=Pleomorphovibrio marinus TaxID=2164132 RepID=UPI001300A44F|nr:hypothetical protein [Pleomorphovibrio marinus]